MRLSHKNKPLWQRAVSPLYHIRLDLSRPAALSRVLDHHHRNIGAEKNSGNHAHRGDDVDMHLLGLLLFLISPSGRLPASSGALCCGFFRSFG